ncbi:sigma-70 family RNA polymerase sigma factor [Myroides albus]|uniref:RNA polymerase sigma factor n=1 Tax=Myroides albus TaxID=2562892 RepID=UPI002159AA1A|nr:sigma-70 family RNA polymerase sigma factor [Myroides albus]UVD79114.1 sigma-70 family RNA polymerase sigma factor [Myroides albus]
MNNLTTDTELVEMIVLSNEKAFTLLIEKYYQSLCVYAYKLIGNEEAQDLVQNVFMKIWIKRLKLNPEANIKNLLYKSVFNEFVDTYRKNKKLEPLEYQCLKVINAYVETNSQEDIELAINLMQREIDNLPNKSKEVFILSKRQGLTNQEIADYLNISLKTVEAHISKSYSILKKRLGENTNILLFLVFGRVN